MTGKALIRFVWMKGQGLEELVQRPETAGHDHIGHGILDEHHLPDEKILVVDADIRVRVRLLLERQPDVHPHGLASGLRGPFVGRLHDAGTAARDDAEAPFGEKPGQELRLLVIGVVRRGPGRAEDAHGILDSGEGFDGLDKFGHDAEDTPGFFDRQGINDKLVFFVHVTLLRWEGTC